MLRRLFRQTSTLHDYPGLGSTEDGSFCKRATRKGRYLVDASEKRVFSLHRLACGAFSLRRLAFGFRRAGPMVAGRCKSTTEGQSKSAGSS